MKKKLIGCYNINIVKIDTIEFEAKIIYDLAFKIILYLFLFYIILKKNYFLND